MSSCVDNCLLCDKPLAADPASIRSLKVNAIKSIKVASIKRKDKKHLQLKNAVSLDVHRHCYDVYIRESSIRAALARASRSLSHNRRRSSEARNFEFDLYCFFCGEDASDTFIKNISKSKKVYKTVSFVTKCETKQSILKRYNQLDDPNDYMKAVVARISNVELHEEKGRYHNDCMKRFFARSGSTNILGRPVSEETVNIVDFVTNYIIEHPDECQYSLKSLIEQYRGSDKPNIKNIKDRLQEYFGDELVIYRGDKCDYHLLFIDSRDVILNNAWYENRSANQEKEEDRIVTMAAKIILNKIRSQHYDLNNYPPPSRFLHKIDEQVPHLLKKFLDIIRRH